MIAKLIGCGLLLLTACGASLAKLGKERRRLAVMEGWIGFLSFAKGEIESRMTPLPRLLEKTDPGFVRLLGSPEKTLEGYLLASKKDLDRDSLDCLSSLLAHFGSSCREGLIEALERTLSTLSQKQQKLASELPKEKMRVVSISRLSVGLIILLLW